MREYFINKTADLIDICKPLKNSEWLALDTEFIREKTYYPKLCLIQISNGEIAACIDPLAFKEADLTILLDVLYDGNILKIWHSARQDLEIFLHDWQQIPLPLFDTQPAAALLGYGNQVGYANLVKQVLDIDLPKDQSRTDWAARPLSEQQIRYALDDVVYLGELYLAMRGKLADRERLQWLAADFAELANPATYAPDPQSLWKKIKGRQHLRGRQLAILQSLAAWRERLARERDLPRKWLLKDDVMVELCRRMPRNLAAMGKIRGVESGLIRREGDALLKLINQACQLDRDAWPTEKQYPQTLTPQQEAMVDLLSAALRLIAAEHQLSPQAIATHKELAKLVRGETDCLLLEGWRRAVAGDQLQRVMHGEQGIRQQNNKLVII